MVRSLAVEGFSFPVDALHQLSMPLSAFCAGGLVVTARQVPRLLPKSRDEFLHMKRMGSKSQGIDNPYSRVANSCSTRCLLALLESKVACWIQTNIGTWNPGGRDAPRCF